MGPILSAVASMAPLIGAGIDWLSGRQQSQENTAAQKEFAQNGIRWRVEDAKAAGIHPLYALGAQTSSFSPVSVGSNFAAAGQDISRSVDAARTAPERTDARIAALSLERAGLENDLLRAQIASTVTRLNQGGQVGPPLPVMSSEGPVPVGPPTANQPIHFNGLTMPANPNMSPSQDVENRYGDVVQELYGMGAFGADVAEMVKRAIRSSSLDPRRRFPDATPNSWVTRARPSQWSW